VTVASPISDVVSEIVGPLFESEARLAVGHALREVCPWFDSSSPITTRFEMALRNEKRQADLFCYCAGDSLGPCFAAPEAGVHVVWPDALLSAVVERALPAAAIGEGARFSPADPSRVGPHKYFVGEAYSGMGVSRRSDKVRQLETEVEFLMRRFADRSGLHISDATSVVGAAAVVFPAEKGPQRSSQVDSVLQLVRENAGPHLQRLARAGRLLLVLLSANQAPQTAAQRDTTVLLKQMRKAQDLQARQVANQHQEFAQQLSAILERLPPIHEAGRGAVTRSPGVASAFERDDAARPRRREREKRVRAPQPERSLTATAAPAPFALVGLGFPLVDLVVALPPARAEALLAPAGLARGGTLLAEAPSSAAVASPRAIAQAALLAALLRGAAAAAAAAARRRRRRRRRLRPRPGTLLTSPTSSAAPPSPPRPAGRRSTRSASSSGSAAPARRRALRARRARRTRGAARPSWGASPPTASRRCWSARCARTASRRCLSARRRRPRRARAASSSRAASARSSPSSAAPAA